MDDLIRVGDKIISIPKIMGHVEDILALRQRGISQADVAKKIGIDRTFISRLEALGEIRKGKTIALIGFPIKNIDEIKEVAVEEGVDFSLLMTDRERWNFVYDKTGIELLNEVMRLIYKAKQCDIAVILGSDYRVRLFRAILDMEIVPIIIGKSPIKEDIYIDPKELRTVIKNLRKGGS